MNLKPAVLGLTAAGVATLVYGALVEANDLRVEHHTLRLQNWPKDLDGLRIALLADFHIRDSYSAALAQRAVTAAVMEAPDYFVLAGDFVGYWKLSSPWLLEQALRPLSNFKGSVIAVPGNHDYWEGDASLLRPILEELNIVLLRNEAFKTEGISWFGLDSLNAKRAMPSLYKRQSETANIVVFHEPDGVMQLRERCDLMLSGHSHGGQFTFPWGWTPMHTKNGQKYVRGFFPEAESPLFVTRGIGTTGPPSRLCCSPEVAILTLRAA